MTAMSVNRDRGEVALVMGGETYVLHYDWRAVGLIRERFGAKEFEAKLAALGDGVDVAGLAEVVVIGLARNHPDMTAEMVLDLSPPMVETVNAFNDALTLGFFGPNGAPEDDGQTDPTKPATSSKGRKRRRSGRA